MINTLENVVKPFDRFKGTILTFQILHNPNPLNELLLSVSRINKTETEILKNLFKINGHYHKRVIAHNNKNYMNKKQ